MTIIFSYFNLIYVLPMTCLVQLIKLFLKFTWFFFLEILIKYLKSFFVWKSLFVKAYIVSVKFSRIAIKILSYWLIRDLVKLKLVNLIIKLKISVKVRKRRRKPLLIFWRKYFLELPDFKFEKIHAIKQNTNTLR